VNDVVLNQVLVSFGSNGATDAVVEAVQRDGTCWMGGTTWRGRRLMRISVSNCVDDGSRRRPVGRCGPADRGEGLTATSRNDASAGRRGQRCGHD
jgi:hypothetical protein